MDRLGEIAREERSINLNRTSVIKEKKLTVMRAIN